MIRRIDESPSNYYEWTGIEKSILVVSFTLILVGALTCALVLVAFIGSSMAATPSASLVGPGSYEEKNIFFTFEQSVQNSGYHMTYLNPKQEMLP